MKFKWKCTRECELVFRRNDNVLPTYVSCYEMRCNVEWQTHTQENIKLPSKIRKFNFKSIPLVQCVVAYQFIGFNNQTITQVVSTFLSLFFRKRLATENNCTPVAWRLDRSNAGGHIPLSVCTAGSWVGAVQTGKSFICSETCETRNLRKEIKRKDHDGTVRFVSW